MIRHTTTQREDRVADAVGCLRAFGSVFVGTGSVSLWAALGGGAGLDEAGAGARLILFLIGASHLGGGLFMWWSRWASAVVRRRGIEWTERGGLRPARHRFIPPSEVEAVLVEQDRDSDGDETFRVALKLQSGDVWPLTHSTSPSEETVVRAARAVSLRLRIPDRVG